MTCPVCRAATTVAWRPFCSRRCADLDLARWLRGDYRLPGESGAADPDETPPAPLDTSRHLS
jgi:hypothetical protein